MGRWCAGTLTTLLLAVAVVAAQQAPGPTSPYLALVDRYAVGDRTAAADVTQVDPREIERALPQVAARGERVASVAAMLHTEAAIGLSASDLTRAAQQLAWSETLARTLPSSAEPFLERYYAFVPTLLLAGGGANEARAWADRGLRLFEFSAPLRTTSGIIAEHLAHLADPECSGRQCAGAAAMMTADQRAAAERDYRVALERDPEYAEARLRLARARAVAGASDEARAALTTLASNRSARVRYLAQLFLADVATQQNDIEAARAAYDAALAANPDGQAARVGLSQLEDSAGNRARARALVASLAGRTTPANDPWWSYQNGGIDEEALQWLVAYVQQPR